MSGRHRRPEPDSLPGIDVAGALRPGPVLEADPPVRAVLEADPPVRPTAADGAPAPAGRPATRPPATSYAAVSVTPRAAALPPAGTTVIGRRNRAAERAARRARARRRASAVGAAVLAVLLVVGVATVLLSRGGDEGGNGAGTTVPAAKARQRTLLVQVAAQDGTAAASALVGVTPARRRATAVLIPSGLLVDVASSGSMPFGETLTVSDTAPGEALTDLLGVRVENRWVLTAQALAALVDKVGGVQAQVDVDVVSKDAKGRETVVVRAGSQRLAGRAAAAYATYLADGEPEAARLARFNEVLDAVVRGLPPSSADVTAALTGLGGGSRSDLKPASLASDLAALRSATVRDGVRYESLPVNDIDTGSTVDAYGLDSAKAGALLQSFFAGSLQRDAAGESVRVLVENGVGTPDLVERARGRLVTKGFQFRNGGNASSLTKDPSVVLVEDGSERSIQRGHRVAAALGLTDDSIEVNPRGQTVADVIVILGSDFRP